MEIIAYKPEHKKRVIALSLEAWAPVFTGMKTYMAEKIGGAVFEQWYKGDWRSVQAAAVESTLDDKDIQSFVAIEGDTVTGFTSLKFHIEEDKMGEVYMIAVDPAHQKKGVATALIEHSVSEMKAAGMQLALIETGADEGHAPARKAYEKSGFRLLPFARYFKTL